MSLKPPAAVPKSDREFQRFCLESHDMNLLSGFGDPEGVVPASPGVLYLNKSGGAGATLWVKESGTAKTGWVAI
jgi:hypothetical protein